MHSSLASLVMDTNMAADLLSFNSQGIERKPIITIIWHFVEILYYNLFKFECSLRFFTSVFGIQCEWCNYIIPTFPTYAFVLLALLMYTALLQSKCLPRVRIELTTFRLWDWRAAYCANKATWIWTPHSCFFLAFVCFNVVFPPLIFDNVIHFGLSFWNRLKPSVKFMDKRTLVFRNNVRC